MRFILIFLFNSIVLAQIGINTEHVNSSALFEVQSSNKGVLFPKVELQSIYDVTTIPNPANGLIVFNTKKSLSSVPPNEQVYKDLVYIYNGTKWETVMSDVNGVLSVNLPKIISKGRKTTIGTSCANSNPFNLDTRDSNMQVRGEIIAPKTGYYKYYMSLNVNKTPKTANPVIGYAQTVNGEVQSNTMTFEFKNINNTTAVTNYDISYSGVTFLEEGELSGYFQWALGGSFNCTNNSTTKEVQNTQEVIWEYLGESL